MENYDIKKLKNYLKRRGVSWRPTEEWSFIFLGNHPEGIFICTRDAPIAYINKLHGVAWEYRGNYSSVYVYPKE